MEARQEFEEHGGGRAFIEHRRREVLRVVNEHTEVLNARHVGVGECLTYQLPLVGHRHRLPEPSERRVLSAQHANPAHAEQADLGIQSSAVNALGSCPYRASGRRPACTPRVPTGSDGTDLARTGPSV